MDRLRHLTSVERAELQRAIDELTVMDYSDAPTNWDRRRDLQATVSRLRFKGNEDVQLEFFDEEV